MAAAAEPTIETLSPYKTITSFNGIPIERNFRGVQPLVGRVEQMDTDNQSYMSAPRLIIRDEPFDEVSVEPVRLEEAPQQQQLPPPPPLQQQPVPAPQPAPQAPPSPPPVAPLVQSRPPSPGALSQRSTLSKHMPPSTLDRLTGNTECALKSAMSSWWKWALAIGAGIVIGNQVLRNWCR